MTLHKKPSSRSHDIRRKVYLSTYFRVWESYSIRCHEQNEKFLFPTTRKEILSMSFRSRKEALYGLENTGEFIIFGQ